MASIIPAKAQLGAALFAGDSLGWSATTIGERLFAPENASIASRRGRSLTSNGTLAASCVIVVRRSLAGSRMESDRTKCWFWHAVGESVQKNVMLNSAPRARRHHVTASR